MTPYPTRQQRQAAGLELVQLAEALARPETSFEQAMSVARAAAPHLAEIVDGHFAAPARATGRPGPPARSLPLSGHQQLLDLAETAREGDPSLTPETAYAEALMAHPEVRAQLAAEQAVSAVELALDERARSGRIRFGEQLGAHVGSPGAPIDPDSEYRARPARWAARATELCAFGAVASPEIGYAAAMSETAAGPQLQRAAEPLLPEAGQTAPPVARSETMDSANHDAWTQRAGELFKSGRAASWQIGYSMAMEGR